MSTTVSEGLCITKLLYGCQFMLVRLWRLLLTVNVKCGTPGAPTGSCVLLGGVHDMSTSDLANGTGLHVGLKDGATLRSAGLSRCCKYFSQSGQLQSATFTWGCIATSGGGVLTAVSLTSQV